MGHPGAWLEFPVVYLQEGGWREADMELLAFLIVVLVFLGAFRSGDPSRPGMLGQLVERVVGRLFGCLMTIVVLMVVVQVVRAEARRWWQSHFGRPAPVVAPADPAPSPTTPEAEPSPPANVSFDYPVGEADAEGRRSGGGWVVTQDFEDVVEAVTPALAGQHLGEDWARSSRRSGGQPVYAIADGVVLLARVDRSYGHVVICKHPLAAGADPPYVVAMYGHLATEGLVAELGPDGQPRRVTRGEQLGKVGAKGDNGVDKHGQPWPEHLHFELRRPGLGDDPTVVDYGYRTPHPAHLNPTSATSRRNEPRVGFIDEHR